MADEANFCKKCTELEVILHEKNCEIERLEVQIQNLKTFLRNYETQPKFCQLCSVTDELKRDTIEDPDVSISQANINNKDTLETVSDIQHSENLRDHFTIKDDDNEKLHSLETLQNNSSCVDVSKQSSTSDQNNTSKKENSSDYIYDEHLKMHYCPSTGYYYDHKSKLFYLPQTRAYYSYNYSKSEYELCETAASDELLKEDCDSVLDKVNCLNISDNEFVTTDEEKLRNNFQQIDGSSENKETLQDEMIEGFSKDWEPTEGSNATVKDLVRNVAEQSGGMSDYIYDEKSAMYYNKSTGHFYDPVKKLLYDSQTKVYYLYIEETASYEFYCKADEAESMSLLPKHDPLRRIHKKKSKKQWRKKVFSSEKDDELLIDDIAEMDADETQDSPEEGEIISTTDSDSESENSTENTPSFGPPCIRAIVKKSAKLKNGSLIVITCTGAVLGRKKFNSVYMPDIGVSKAHAEIIFNNDFWKYTIEDLGSQNGTFVNDVRLSEPKQKSEPLALNHGDILTLGSCELLLHIHEGYITCDKCEPGQVLAEISAQEIKPVAVLKTKEEKEKERREEMSRLKKKYGLKGIEYVSGKKPVASGSKYEDKAETRRKTVGSQNPYEKTEVASMHERITKSNKGFQMLKKLGWKEGDSLGLNGSGISEPIPLRPWLSKAGLGSLESQATTQPLNPQQDKRQQRWVKAQERYLQLT